MQTFSLLLIGFGSVHQAFAHLLLEKREVLAQRYGLAFRVVGVVDSRGAVVQDGGLDLAALLAYKAAGHSVGTFPSGKPLPDALTLARTATYDLLLEASPVNLVDGEPALGCVRAALAQGRGAVLANKAPLVLDFRGLHALAAAHNAGLAFSATVCGGLPVINVGRRDLVAADIHRIEGIFNSTSNYILTRMAAGESYDDALAEAQRRGLAETDPSLDVDGWDTANKLVILANAILGLEVGLEDVRVQGMRGLGQDEVMAARRQGEMFRLIATAARIADGWRLEVRPRRVPLTSFLGGIDLWEMGIVFHTDIFEDVYLKIDERGPLATAAAMLRDAVHLSLASKDVTMIGFRG
ncbi:MAG TPA: homoserine dehydrogenase [Anaerolineae bacterium]|nr:homoserine dehydrogenase [Anaerolineae bacterium]